MNFYGLPEFISYGVLVGIACVLIRQQRDAALGYWLVGWVLILVHAGIFMLLPAQFPFDVLGRGTLTVAGQTFMLAAYCQRLPQGIRPAHLLRMAVWGGVNLVFALASAAYGETTIVDHGPAPYYVLIALGTAAGLWLALSERRRPRTNLPLSAALICAVYGAQAVVLYVYGVTMASQWLMCWTYLAVAYFFVRKAPQLSMGVIFTALSFVLWGLVFPVYSLLMLYAPAVSANIEAGVWNLPKFLAAASMILLLLEQKVANATRLATHDELTGLPNRRLYQERFDRAVARSNRTGSGFGFLVIDLDRFKFVNDTLGHQAGDTLLRVVSARFAAALRTTDLIARTGGDEFTVIMDGVTSLDEAIAIANNLHGALVEPVDLGSGRLHVAAASIGAAIYPTDGSSQLLLQAIADERMYASKQLSRQLAAVAA